MEASIDCCTAATIFDGIIKATSPLRVETRGRRGKDMRPQVGSDRLLTSTHATNAQPHLH